MAINVLRQATASQSRIVGPFVDDTDFKTAETALTIANTDVKLLINGAASVNKNSGGGTHRVNGMYSLTFDATDTATVGEIEVSIVVAGALPVFKTFFVLEEAVYDALFAASAPGYLQPATAGRQLVVDAAGLADANMVKMGPTGSGTAQTARDIGASVLLSVGTGTGQVNLSSGAVPITSNIKRNQALAAFEFPMTDSTTHNPETGLTVSVTRSIDGGAFASGTLSSVTEVGAGIYKVDFAAADLNGKVVTLRATATGADDTLITIITDA